LRNSDIGWKNSILTQLSWKLYLHTYIVGGMIFLSPIQEKIFRILFIVRQLWGGADSLKGGFLTVGQYFNRTIWLVFVLDVQDDAG
jgi:hypothetical protein